MHDGKTYAIWVYQGDGVPYGKVNTIDQVMTSLTFGAEQVKVPAIKGRLASAATGILTYDGLQVGHVSVKKSTQSDSGRIVSQSIAPGSVVQSGTTVNLVLGAAPGTITLSRGYFLQSRGLPEASAYTAGTQGLDASLGRPTALYFWTPPCTSCQPAELNWALRVNSSYVDETSIYVTGVEVRDPNPISTMLHASATSESSVADPNGAIAADFGVTKFPTTVFLDPYGHITARVFGRITKGQFRTYVRNADAYGHSYVDTLPACALSQLTIDAAQGAATQTAMPGLGITNNGLPCRISGRFSLALSTSSGEAITATGGPSSKTIDVGLLAGGRVDLSSVHGRGVRSPSS